MVPEPELTKPNSWEANFPIMNSESFVSFLQAAPISNTNRDAKHNLLIVIKLRIKWVNHLLSRSFKFKNTVIKNKRAFERNFTVYRKVREWYVL